MAKKAKGNRVQVILECTEMKNSGVAGTSRYVTTKNRKNTPERETAESLNVAIATSIVCAEFRRR